MKLQSKLLLAQSPLALALLAAGAITAAMIVTIDRSAEGIRKDNYVSVVAAQQMRDAADELGRLALLGQLGDPLDDGARERVRVRFERELQRQRGNITEPGEAEATARLGASWSRLGEALAAARSPRRYADAVLPELAAVAAAAAEIETINERAILRNQDAARRATLRMGALLLLATCGALGVGMILSSRLTAHLVRPISSLSRAVERVAADDLAVHAVLEGNDELAALGRQFNHMARRLASYRTSAAHELELARRTMQAAIDSLPDSVLVVDDDGRILNVNRVAARLLGCRPGRQEALAAVAPEVCGQVAKMRDHVLAGLGAYVPRSLEEAVLVETSDGPRYLLPRASPMSDDSAFSGLTILFEDVTRLRRFDELKNNLVATVAHEFRTPLTSLRMAIHLCGDGIAGPLAPVQEELLSGARADCDRLRLMVDELLDLSRIQAGRIELDRRPVSAASLLERALELHGAAARAAGIALTMRATGTGPEDLRPVLADPERVDVVLGNLIVNALRHTPAGGSVELCAERRGATHRVEVRDNGSGIAREYVPRLFERFYRVPGAPAGGAGFGLYICKVLIEAHGGEIGVETAPEHGSVFWFTLPGDLIGK